MGRRTRRVTMEAFVKGGQQGTLLGAKKKKESSMNGNTVPTRQAKQDPLLDEVSSALFRCCMGKCL